VKELKAVSFEFVENVPSQLKEDTLYVSIKYATVVHRCLCGCGNEVVTPLSPTDWALTFDGETISLDPSVGSWSLACQSHYWIDRNTVHWAPTWSRERIRAGRAADLLAKARYHDDRKSSGSALSAERTPQRPSPDGEGFWSRFARLWRKGGG